jgi:hypothetical protein
MIGVVEVDHCHRIANPRMWPPCWPAPNLKGLKTLQVLDLTNCVITDRQLASLKGLTNLKMSRPGIVPVTSPGVKTSR